MNQHLSRRRLELLLKRDFREHRTFYLTYLGLVLGLMLLLMVPIVTADRFSGNLFSLHGLALVVCLWLAGSLFGSTAFSAYSSPGQGIPALMLPASALEKFLAILLVQLFFLVLFLSAYWSLHHGLIGAANDRLLRMAAPPSLYIPFGTFTGWVMSYYYLLFQAAALVGSIYFPRHAFIKTAAAFFAVFVALLALNSVLAQATTRLNMTPHPFNGWRFHHAVSNRMHHVTLPDPYQWMVVGLMVLLVLGLWYTAYLRLKEKEI